MGEKSSRGKKGTKKYGRDKVKCARYRAQGTREKKQAQENREGETQADTV